jgi:hypothetical protein
MSFNSIGTPAKAPESFGGLYPFLLHELGKTEAVKIRIFGKTHVSFLARG